MKVLVVCSGTAVHFSLMKHQAFIYDQVEAVKRYFPGIGFDFYFVKSKGISGYLHALPGLKKKMSSFNPDLIHAHGGHTGMLCGMQRKVPVVVTFHGSDINLKNLRIISMAASALAAFSIFVSSELYRKSILRKNRSAVIPCGIDFNLFKPVLKQDAIDQLGLPAESRYILFGSQFTNSIKNYPLAASALNQITPVRILEISDRSREEVNLLINGAELLLLTSFSEGSPQIIKEAMACNCPIVATNVGDISEIIGGTEGCYLTTFDPQDVAEKIELALAFGRRTDGRERVRHLDNKVISGKIVELYKNVTRNA